MQDREGSKYPVKKDPAERNNVMQLISSVIQPTPDNQIPPNGIFPTEDRLLGDKWSRFMEDPLNEKARFDYLDYVRKIGDKDGIDTYLGFLNKKDEQLPSLSSAQQLKEAEMLAEAFMNAAEAQRRRDENSFTLTLCPQTGMPKTVVCLIESLRYEMLADELMEKLKERRVYSSFI